MSEVLLCEVGPRDGLQNSPHVLPVDVRVEMVSRLSATGLRKIEVTSFVNPKVVPQMACAEDVVRRVLGRGTTTTYAGLVLNERGLDRALSVGLREVHFVMSSSETFNRRNANVSRAESAAALDSLIRRARSLGLYVTATAGNAFGCPFEGNVDPGVVIDMCARFCEAGAQELTLADTTGVAAPTQVRRLVERAREICDRVGVHLHNTRNTGYANAVAALEAGACTLDASIGGLGGCPFAPDASGNIATEDLVYLLDREGVTTGVDLDALVRVSWWLRRSVGLHPDGLLHRIAKPSADAAGAPA